MEERPSCVLEGEAAYWCTDLFERQRRFTDDWSVNLARESRDPEGGPIRWSAVLITSAMAQRETGPQRLDLGRGSVRVGGDRRGHITQRGACALRRHFHMPAGASSCGWPFCSCGAAAEAAVPLQSSFPVK